MKRRLPLISIIFCLSIPLFAQETVRMNAVKANNYGVAYTLPKTSLVIEFTIKKTIFQRGDFYPYAQRYLNINNPITEDRIVYSIEDVHIENAGIPNKENSFLVEFKSNSLEPYLFLTKEGLICSINAQPEFDTLPKQTNATLQNKESDINPRQFFTEEIIMAGSTAKQAELIAKQIYALRQSHSDILMGEAENMPPDGEAYKLVMTRLEEQQAALTSLFSGKTNDETWIEKVTIIPDKNNIDRKVVARFSSKLGLVDSDDLAGKPLYLSLKNKTPIQHEELSERERQRMEKKFSSGVVYNIPSKGILTIDFEGETIHESEVDIVQFGSQEVLTKRMFDNLKKPISVIFYPHLGAIKQIIQ